MASHDTGWRVSGDPPVWTHPTLGIIKMVETSNGKGGTVEKFDWYNTRGELRTRFSSITEAKLMARRITRPTRQPEYK